MRSLIAIALVLTVLGCQSQEARIAEHEERANAYFENEEWGEAKIEFLNLIQVDPENAEARTKLGDTLYKLGEYADALWQFQEAVRLDPEDVEKREKLAALLLAARKLDDARVQVDEILSRDPTHADALLMRSRLRGAEGDNEGMFADIDAVLERDPDNVNALLIQSQTLVRMKRDDEAEKSLRHLTEVKPVPGSFALLAMFLNQQGRSDEAEAAYRQAIASASSEGEKRSARLSLANFFLVQGDREAAERELLIAREENPDNAELLVALGRYYTMTGQREKAEQIILQRVEQHPDDAAQLVTLASFYRASGRPEEAMEALDRALAIDPEREDALVMRAEMLVQKGVGTRGNPGPPELVEEGTQIIDRVLEANPKSNAGLYVKAKLLMSEGKNEEASIILRRVLEEQSDVRAHYLLGTAYLSMRQDDLARGEFLAGLQQNATHVPSRRQLAGLYLRTGSPELAAQEARKGLRVAKGDPTMSIVLAEALIKMRDPEVALITLDDLPLETDEISPALRLRATGSYLDLDQIEKARAIARRVLEESPADVQALHRMLLIEARAGDPMKAVTWLNAAVVAEPENPELYRIRGGFYLGFRRQGTMIPMFPTEAQADLLTALEKEPDSAATNVLLGKLRDRMGNKKEAISYFNRAIEFDPNYAEAYLNLGVLYEQEGQLDKAVEMYSALVTATNRKGLTPRDLAVAMNNLAWLLADNPNVTPEELDRALELAQEAKELRPDDPSIADTLGWVMYKRDIQAAAISLFREAIASYSPGPNRAMTRYHLALSYEKNGEPDRAIEQLRAALEESDSFPGRDDAEATLKRLES